MKAPRRTAASFNRAASHRAGRGTFAAACLALFALAPFLGSAAPTASAAEGECPNEAIRVQQGSTHLPDCRAWEMVSLADKSLNPVRLASPPVSSGGRIVYTIDGAAPDATTGATPLYVANRGATGWTSTYMLPPTADRLGTAYPIGAATPGLTRFVASAFVGLGNDVGSPDLSLALLDGRGGQSLLHTFPTAFGASGASVVASDDLRHVYVSVAAGADPGLPDIAPGVDLLYDFGGGTPQLVSRMPGTDLAPLCGTPTGEEASPGPDYMQSQHWVSTDGSRVLFATRGDTCSDPMQLYMRDVNAGTTTQISASPLGPDNGIVRFVQATPTGSQVFYLTSTSYDPADSADANDSDMDVYRWTAATGVNLCVTCGVASAEVLDPVAVSEDGSHVYFSSAAQLADAPSAADTENPNTYVWQLGHASIRFVVRASGVTPIPSTGGYVTPNGDVLLFTSGYAGLDSLTDGSNGGNSQFYRYDNRDGSVTCLSCPSRGAAASSVPFSLAVGNQPVMSQVRPASDDGNTVFFGSSDALVPEDVNGRRDIYEWHDGVVKLITSGTTAYPSTVGPIVVSTTPDGHDVFFTDQARLTADAQDDAAKLYDARVDGGFALPPASPAPCQEQQCFGSPAPQPGSLSGGSETVSDPGNLDEGHVRKKHRHRHTHHRKHKRANADRRASR